MRLPTSATTQLRLPLPHFSSLFGSQKAEKTIFFTPRSSSSTVIPTEPCSVACFGHLIAIAYVTGAVVLYDLKHQTSCLATQLHAKGVHTQLALEVAFSPDGQWVLAGAARGSVELVAIYVESFTAGRYKLSSNSHLSVLRHADGQLRGFSAMTRVQNKHGEPVKPAQYLLLTGKGIKTGHVWRFVPESSIFHKIMDMTTNGNSINYLQFRRNSGKLSVLSQNPDSPLQVWQVGHLEAALAAVPESQEACYFAERPIVTDIPESSDSMACCGGEFCLTGRLDALRVIDIETGLATEVAVPLPEDARRFSRRRTVPSVVQVASLLSDGGQAVVETDDGQLWRYRPATATLTGWPTLEPWKQLDETAAAGGKRQMHLTRLGREGVACLITATYEGPEQLGRLELCRIDEGIVIPGKNVSDQFPSWGFQTTPSSHWEDQASMNEAIEEKNSCIEIHTPTSGGKKTPTKTTAATVVQATDTSKGSTLPPSVTPANDMVLPTPHSKTDDHLMTLATVAQQQETNVSRNVGTTKFSYVTPAKKTTGKPTISEVAATPIPKVPTTKPKQPGPIKENTVTPETSNAPAKRSTKNSSNKRPLANRSNLQSTRSCSISTPCNPSTNKRMKLPHTTSDQLDQIRGVDVPVSPLAKKLRSNDNATPLHNNASPPSGKNELTLECESHLAQLQGLLKQLSESKIDDRGGNGDGDDELSLRRSRLSRAHQAAHCYLLRRFCQATIRLLRSLQANPTRSCRHSLQPVIDDVRKDFDMLRENLVQQHALQQAGYEAAWHVTLGRNEYCDGQLYFHNEWEQVRGLFPA